jgi:hypothetical protein
MRLTKSLCGIAAMLLAVGTAYAGGDSTVEGSIETSPPEMMASEPSELALESDVIYLYPIEVTEYYLVIPQSPELG